ncbi:MAG: ankyrin repeat domain-containing protein, partial [Pirellulaceae bacterium]
PNCNNHKILEVLKFKPNYMRYLLLAFSILLFSSNLIAGVLENNLIKAVEEGNLVEATKQVELGADINFQDANGDTALIKATKAGDEKLAKYLVEQGADTQITNNA